MEQRDRTTDDEDGAQSGPVVHGGEGDPLGEGVAELEDDDAASGETPEQKGETSERE